MQRFFDLHEIVELVDAANRNPIIDAYVENAELVAQAPGARKKHQAWEGGYLDHVVYATSYALALHNLHKELGFEPDHYQGDIALVMLLHDFGKIVKYEKVGVGWDYVDNAKDAEHQFLEQTIERYGFQLSEEQENALEFVHGEGSKYNPEIKLMQPLAVVCHNADIWSARFCPERPLTEDKETWPGAYRHSEIEDLVDYIKDLRDLEIK